MPLKISLYCSALEALFSNSEGGEIAHKVDERTALYLGGNSTLKSQNYEFIKSAYEIRSKLFYGGVIKKNKAEMDYLITVLTWLDEKLRKIMTKVVMKDSNLFNDGSLQAYFNELIFGKVNLQLMKIETSAYIIYSTRL